MTNSMMQGLASANGVRAAAVALCVVACATYLYIATKEVYGAHGALRVLKVAALTVVVVGIVLGYRFALLVITLYTT